MLEYMEEGKIHPAGKVGPEGGGCQIGNWLKGLAGGVGKQRGTGIAGRDESR